MRNIVLIGMMGCGKSACGKRLAQVLGREFVDTDALIEAKQGRSIPDIFATDGEDFFRRLEVETARELAAREGLVIACGGGLPMVEEAMKPLADSGNVVFLDRDPRETFLHVSMANRPLGQQGEEAFVARYEQRRPVYQRWAGLTVPSKPPVTDTVNLILEGSR